MSHAEHPIYAFSDGFVDRLAVHRPASATMWGIPGHDHAWDDLSPDGVAAWAAFLDHETAALARLEPATERWAVLARDIADAYLDLEKRLLASGYPYRCLGHVASPFQGFHLTLSHMARAGGDEDAIRARLAGLSEALEGYRAALEHGLAVDERVAVRQVRSCVDQGRNVVDRRLLDVIEAPETEAAHRAYARLTDWLETAYLPRARAEDGVGEERYAVATRTFLHVDLDLDETYAWGWQRVTELHRELVALLERTAPGKSLGEAVEAWRTDEATTASDPEAFLDRVRGWQHAALSALSELLPVPPIARELRIERAPTGLPPGAWYLSPSEDGTRAAVVQYSLPDGRVPVFDQQSTACHEGFPGHHLQLSIQTTFQDRLSRLHRVPFHCIGFSEGWALYAERLCDERGLYDDDVQRVGYLVNQIARAARVVLDIGLHTGRPMARVPLPEKLGGRDTGYAPGAVFDFARAVAFMTEIGGLRREVSESEITRYLGWPGQAISYAVGQKTLLDLRERFLGGGGTLQEFHERVLGMGTVGLGRVARELGPG